MLQNSDPAERPRLAAMIGWIELRLKAIEALLGPVFLDISARNAEVEFDEAAAAAGPKGEEQYRYYSRDVKLLFWAIDEEKGQATSVSRLDWATAESVVPPG